jgi:hypothetical protein
MHILITALSQEISKNCKLLKKHRTKYSVAQNLLRLLMFMNQVAREMFYGNLILEDAMRRLVVSIMLNSKK